MLYLNLPTHHVKALTRAALQDEYFNRVVVFSHQWESTLDSEGDDVGVHADTYIGKQGTPKYGTCVVVYYTTNSEDDAFLCGMDVCESYTGEAKTKHYRLKEHA